MPTCNRQCARSTTRHNSLLQKAAEQVNGLCILPYHSSIASLTTAYGLFLIQVQVKPESHSIHFALCSHFQLYDVVSASTLSLALEKVVEHLARLGEAGMGELVQQASLIALVPSALHTQHRLSITAHATIGTHIFPYCLYIQKNQRRLFLQCFFPRFLSTLYMQAVHAACLLL